MKPYLLDTCALVWRMAGAVIVTCDEAIRGQVPGCIW